MSDPEAVARAILAVMAVFPGRCQVVSTTAEVKAAMQRLVTERVSAGAHTHAS